MTFVSSKDILLSYSILNNQNNSSSTDNTNISMLARSRGKKNIKEFQAFAYKLAFDLNDLENLPLYLNLVKNVDRSLIEQAYSFVIDAGTIEKNKLFLWKIKELRKSIQHKINMNNFSLDFILKKTKQARNELCKEVLERIEIDFDDQKKMFFLNVFKVVNEVKQKYAESSIKILFLGAQSKKLYNLLSVENIQFDILEISQKIYKFQKESLKKEFSSKNFRIYNTDIFKKTYKDKMFDLIVFDYFWNSICINSEITLFNTLLKYSHQNTLFCFAYRLSQDSKIDQKWKHIINPKNSNKTLYLFFKYQTDEYIQSLLDKFNFKIKLRQKINSHIYVLFSRF